VAVILDREMEGRPLSWHLGVAWYDPARRAAIVYPVPFNVLARILRNIWLWCLAGHGSRWDEELLKAEQAGRESVWEYANRLYNEADARRNEMRELRREGREAADKYASILLIAKNITDWADGRVR